MAIFRPGQSSDDGELMIVETPVFNYTNPGINVGGPPGDFYADGGFRFINVTVPAGTITSAKITFRAGATNAAVCNLRIKGHDVNNSATFSTWGDFVTRVRTTEFVNWTPTAWVATSDYDTPDISTIIQEIVDRPGWVSGNNLTIFAEHVSGLMRYIRSYDGDTVNCARLEIIATPPGPTRVMRHMKWFSGGTFQGFWLGWR